MSFRERIAGRLRRQITVLVIPHAEHKPRRVAFSAGFALFMLGLWSGVTLWAGYLAGRHVDYWITKADNMVMRTKLTYLAGEMDKSREVLDTVRSTDKELRALLSLSQKRDVLEAGATSVGGPTASDRFDFKRMLTGSAAGINQQDLRRRVAALKEEANRRLASFQEISWYILNQRNLYQATPNIWPTEGQITSLYGYRFAPIERRDGEGGEYHQGIDIANHPDTLIHATADGTVRQAGWSHGYGQIVLIDHGFGLSTLYAHTSKSLVKAGDRVGRGQVIAYMGTTGRSTGAHLHYEVWRHSKPVNPMAFLKVRAGTELLAVAPDAVAAAGR